MRAGLAASRPADGLRLPRMPPIAAPAGARLQSGCGLVVRGGVAPPLIGGDEYTYIGFERGFLALCPRGVYSYM